MTKTGLLDSYYELRHFNDNDVQAGILDEEGNSITIMH